MQERVFLQLTERLNQTQTLDVWLDVDRIIGVRDIGNGSVVYLDGMEAMVNESGAEVMDRLHRAAQAMAEQRSR